MAEILSNPNEAELDTTKDDPPSRKINEISKEKSNEFLSMDKILERISFGIYQLRIYLIVGLLSMSEGAQVMIYSLTIPILENEWKIDPSLTALQMSLMFLFSLLGAVSSGKISDKLGRKTPFAVASYFLVLASAFSAGSPNIYVMIGVRSFMAYLLGLVVPIGTTLIAEITPVIMRGRYMSILGFAFSLGHIFGLVCAYAILPSLRFGNWRLLILICSFPGMLGCLLINFYMEESARYLLLQRHSDKAFQVIEQMIESNSDQTLTKLSETQKEKLLEWVDLILQSQDESRKGSFFSLFSRKMRKITFIVWFNWFCSNFVYYGIVIYMPKVIMELETTSAKQSIYLILMSTLGEIFSVSITSFVIELHGFGRKNSLVIFNFFTSIVCLVVYIDTPARYIIWASIAKLLTSMTSSIISSFTSEVYPTKIRTTGYGYASALGKMGGILMPWVSSFLIEIDPKLPFLCFLVFSFAASGINILLPYDTMDMELDCY